MYWSRELMIFQNQYKKYILVETTGYSRSKEHISSGKQKDVISVLENLLRLQG